MPFVAKSVEDALRSVHPNLALMFDEKIERWKVVLFKEMGKYDEVFRVETPAGEYMEPRQDVVQRILQNDLARIPGATQKDKINNLLQSQDKANAERAEAFRQKGIADLEGRMEDWQKKGSHFTEDVEGLQKHMDSDSELHKDSDLTDAERRRVNNGLGLA